ncbi:MAG: hypothetical protein M1457_03455 [bacterium]|nr:hypothetical protein [bacterium]
MLNLRKLLVLFVLAGALQGCTYFQKRAHDARDIIDLGFTFSAKPQFSLYASGPFVQVFTAGVGKVDGRFFGLGEGDFHLWGPHYEKSVGLAVWGLEWLSYQHTESEIEAMPKAQADEAANYMQVGLVGMPLGYSGAVAPSGPGPKYIGSCPHYLHLGWIGVVATPRYLQAFDFVLGWTTLDILGDDEARLAKQ